MTICLGIFIKVCFLLIPTLLTPVDSLKPGGRALGGIFQAHMDVKRVGGRWPVSCGLSPGMARVYHPRHRERTVLYRVSFHHFDRFLIEYKNRFEKQYAFFRPIIREVVERYLDCGNSCCGFASIRCPNCRRSVSSCFPVEAAGSAPPATPGG